MTNYPNLFSEITISGHTLRNRICLCATVTNFAHANRITEPWRNFLIERARGGAAMLVTEVIAVDPEAIAQPSTITGFDDTNTRAFEDIANDIHKEDALLIGQLWHPGRQQLWHPTKSPIGVSDLPDPYSWTVPHVMDTDEILRVANAYVLTAKRLADCGFDGIELHGAHGYLIMQFLSPVSNIRTDQFGGDIDGRTLFVRTIAKGIKQSCGDHFIIGLKMPADEGITGGITPDYASVMTERLSRTGYFSYFAYGQGNFSLSLETHVPDLYFNEGHFINLHKRMRSRAKGVPVMALGRIGSPDLAEMVVKSGYGDLVGMSRALISDPALPVKARTGNVEAIRPCVYDNFPWGEIHLGKPLREHHNPHIGEHDEAFKTPSKANTNKRVTVVGGGPAGLEAAWVAAAKGHHVKLFSKSNKLGGSLLTESRLPNRSKMKAIIDHQIYCGKMFGVEYILNHTITKTEINKVTSDVIVLATGAVQRPPKTLKDGPKIVSARDYSKTQTKYFGNLAVLIDEDHGPATYGVADLIATNFKKIVLITSRPFIAGNVNYCSAIGVLRRLHSANVEILTAREIINFSNGTLALRNPYNSEESEINTVDLVVYSTPRTSNDDLYAQLGKIEKYRIGDCYSPRNLFAAIQGGYATADSL